MPTVGEKLRETARALRCVADEHEAAYQARLLLCHTLQASAEALVLRANEAFPDAHAGALDALVRARIGGEPLQYLLGSWAFMGLMFLVGPGVLIPRQDTETLCEHALALAKAQGYQTALDLCCGSGCVGIALAKLGGLRVTLADISKDALAYAKKNAAQNGVVAELVCSDLFSQVEGRFDLLLCNPPYIPTGEIASLQVEVRREPVLALDGGADGLDFYRRLAQQAQAYLVPGGTLLLEIGVGQAEAVCGLFSGAYAVQDIRGVARVVVARAGECL